MAIPLKVFPLLPPKAPNLLVAPTDYNQQYQDQFSNALRLYFNQLDNFFSGISQPAFGASLRFPFIGAYDTTTQYATADDTPTIVTWNTLTGGNGFTLNTNGTITAAYAGYYKVTYSAELANNDNAIHDAEFWLRVNNVDAVESATIFTLPQRKSAGVPTYLCGYSEVMFQLNVGDVVALWWGTDKAATSGGTTGVYIPHKAAQASPLARPSVPSVIGSITFVSGITP